MNFRDMGGLEAADGRRIKAGKLFRTAIIAPKTDNDKAFIESLRLDAVIDLRTDAEISEKTEVLPKDVEYVRASVFDKPELNAIAPTKDLLKTVITGSEETINGLMRAVVDSYRYMPYAKVAFSEIFSRMNEGKTLAFHCTAGKDRTGVAAMLIELALGRDRDACLQEYLLSNEYRAEDNRRSVRKYRFIPVRKYVAEFCAYVFETHEELFDAAYDAIFSKYERIEDFFRDEYGISARDIEGWKAFYLE